MKAKYNTYKDFKLLLHFSTHIKSPPSISFLPTLAPESLLNGQQAPREAVGSKKGCNNYESIDIVPLLLTKPCQQSLLCEPAVVVDDPAECHLGHSFQSPYVARNVF